MKYHLIVILSSDAVVCFQQSEFCHKTRMNKRILGRKNLTIGIMVYIMSECSEGKKERERERECCNVQAAIVRKLKK